MNRKKLVKWILLIIWMILIFMFSHQPNSSSETKNIVAYFLPNIKNTKTLDIINFAIRKSAHITEYFILSALLYSLQKEYIQKRKTNLLLNIILCFIYASIDEYHQMFIEGRTATINDCIIDITGTFIYIIANVLYIKLKGNKLQIK